MAMGAGSGVARLWFSPWMPSLVNSAGMPSRVCSTNQRWIVFFASTWPV